MIYYLFDNNFFTLGTKMPRDDPDLVGSVINWPLGSGPGPVSQDYGSVDPDPKEIFTAPQHCSIVSTQYGSIQETYFSGF
jgi:hypothetical protein